MSYAFMCFARCFLPKIQGSQGGNKHAAYATAGTHLEAPPDQTTTPFTVRARTLSVPVRPVKQPFRLRTDFSKSNWRQDTLAVSLKDKTDALAVVQVGLFFFVSLRGKGTLGSPCVACG